MKFFKKIVMFICFIVLINFGKLFNLNKTTYNKVICYDNNFKINKIKSLINELISKKNSYNFGDDFYLILADYNNSKNLTYDALLLFDYLNSFSKNSQKILNKNDSLINCNLFNNLYDLYVKNKIIKFLQTKHKKNNQLILEIKTQTMKTVGLIFLEFKPFNEQNVNLEIEICFLNCYDEQNSIEDIANNLIKIAFEINEINFVVFKGLKNDEFYFKSMENLSNIFKFKQKIIHKICNFENFKFVLNNKKC